MKFDEKKAESIIKKFGLKKDAWRVWKTRDAIPDKYFDDSGRIKESLDAEMKYIIQRNKRRLRRAKSNVNCPYCSSNRITQREKGTNIKKCLNCKRAFNLSPDFQKREKRMHDAHLVVTAYNVLRVSSALAAEMKLTRKSKVALAEHNGQLLLIRDKNGFAFHNSANKKQFRINNQFFAQKIRAFFKISDTFTFVVKGEVNKNNFVMKVYNKLNIPKVSKRGRHGTPFLTISKHNQVRLSAALVNAMMLEKGDKVVISEDKKKLFIAISNDKNAFNVHVLHSGATITSSVVGQLIKEHFGIEITEKITISVSETPLEVEKLYFFQLLNIE